MSVWVNHMAGRPRDAAVRGALNWLVMMALTCGFELRNHASYAKQRQLLQRAAAEEEERAAPAAQALPRARLAGAHAPPAEPGGSRGPRKLAAKEAWEQEEEQWESHEGHFFSDLPMPEKPLGGARGACGSAAATGVAVGASGGLPGGGEESQPVGAAGEKGGQEDPVAQQRWDQPSPQQQQQQQPRAQAPRSEQLASDQGQQATAAAGRPSGSSMERRSPPAAGKGQLPCSERCERCEGKGPRAAAASARGRAERVSRVVRGAVEGMVASAARRAPAHHTRPPPPRTRSPPNACGCSCVRRAQRRRSAGAPFVRLPGEEHVH